jgi:hypothetical protein
MYVLAAQWPICATHADYVVNAARTFLSHALAVTATTYRRLPVCARNVYAL